MHETTWERLLARTTPRAEHQQGGISLDPNRTQRAGPGRLASSPFPTRTDLTLSKIPELAGTAMPTTTLPCGPDHKTTGRRPRIFVPLERVLGDSTHRQGLLGPWSAKTVAAVLATHFTNLWWPARVLTWDLSGTCSSAPFRASPVAVIRCVVQSLLGLDLLDRKRRRRPALGPCLFPATGIPPEAPLPPMGLRSPLHTVMSDLHAFVEQLDSEEGGSMLRPCSAAAADCVR